jgi:hypothetical protein
MFLIGEVYNRVEGPISSVLAFFYIYSAFGFSPSYIF